MNLRTRIIDESCRLFMANGIKTVTMDDIAKAMGISKRTLYENFTDKTQLLTESVEVFLDQQKEEQDRLIHSNQNCIEIFLAFYSTIANGFDCINRNYIRELKRYYPNIYRRLDEAGEERMASQVELLEEGKRLGLIRKEINSEIASQLIRVQFEMLWHSDVFTMKTYSINEVLATVILNFARGIATAEGIRIIDEHVENIKIR